jgi:hypothetical protein
MLAFGGMAKLTSTSAPNATVRMSERWMRLRHQNSSISAA